MEINLDATLIEQVVSHAILAQLTDAKREAMILGIFARRAESRRADEIARAAARKLLESDTRVRNAIGKLITEAIAKFVSDDGLTTRVKDTIASWEAAPDAAPPTRRP